MLAILDYGVDVPLGGSGAQRAIGTGVLGGMLAGTLLGVFFTPLFYVIIEKLKTSRRTVAAEAHPA